MNLCKNEILPGVWLTALTSRDFHDTSLSLQLLTPLSRETAGLNALIPAILCRGSSQFDSEEKMLALFHSLGGSRPEPVVHRCGEIQCVGVRASFNCVPEDDAALRKLCITVSRFLTDPATRGGLLLPSFCDEERDRRLNFLEMQDSAADYALRRCAEEMCCYEEYAVPLYGTEDDIAGISYKKLTRYYRTLLQNSPVEVFFVGNAEVKNIRRALKEALSGLPRGEINEDLGTDVRMNSVEEESRVFDEEVTVGSDCTVVGFRLGDWMDDPDPACAAVFNRLCPGFSCDLHKGICMIRRNASEEEILRSVGELAVMEDSSFRLSSAVNASMEALDTLSVSAADCAELCFDNVLLGLEYTPEELKALISEITAADIRTFASSMEADLIYHLKVVPEDNDHDADD